MRRVLESLFVSILMAVAIPAFGQIQININVGPPRPLPEVRIAAPSAGTLWIPGYYVYSGSGTTYNWVPGHWEAPPAPGHVWVAPRYVHRGNHYVYYPGHWHDNGRHLGQLKQKSRPQSQVRPQKQPPGLQYAPGKGKGRDKDHGEGNGKGRGNSGKDGKDR